MYSKIFLALTRKGGARVTRKRPALKANEVCLELELEIPNQVFDKPQFQVGLKVDPKDVSSPVITPDIKDNIAEIIKQQTGVNVKITVDAATFESLSAAEKQQVLEQFDKL